MTFYSQTPICSVQTFINDVKDLQMKLDSSLKSYTDESIIDLTDMTVDKNAQVDTMIEKCLSEYMSRKHITHSTEEKNDNLENEFVDDSCSLSDKSNVQNHIHEQLYTYMKSLNNTIESSPLENVQIHDNPVENEENVDSIDNHDKLSIIKSNKNEKIQDYSTYQTIDNKESNQSKIDINSIPNENMKAAYLYDPLFYNILSEMPLPDSLCQTQQLLSISDFKKLPTLKNTSDPIIVYQCNQKSPYIDNNLSNTETMDHNNEFEEEELDKNHTLNIHNLTNNHVNNTIIQNNYIQESELPVFLHIYVKEQTSNKYIHEFLFHSNQTLLDVMDSFKYMCTVSDEIEDVHSNSLLTHTSLSDTIYMEGILYSNTQLVNKMNYYTKIQEWYKNEHITNPPSIIEKDINIKLSDINFVLGNSYIYLHHNICQHIFEIREIFTNYTYAPIDLFPIHIINKREEFPMCMCCKTLLGQYICINSLLSPNSPMIYCKKCLQMLHYNKENKLITPNFQIQEIKHN